MLKVGLFCIGQKQGLMIKVAKRLRKSTGICIEITGQGKRHLPLSATEFIAAPEYRRQEAFIPAKNTSEVIAAGFLTNKRFEMTPHGDMRPDFLLDIPPNYTFI